MGKLLERMMDKVDEEYQEMGIHLDLVDLNKIAMRRLSGES